MHRHTIGHASACLGMPNAELACIPCNICFETLYQLESVPRKGKVFAQWKIGFANWANPLVKGGVEGFAKVELESKRH